MRRATLLGCLFLSGVAGLIYEICWIRRATLVFGSTSLALSSVVAVFFLGLAAGSEVFGRISLRVSRPLRLFAILEITLAGFGVASSGAFSLAESGYGILYRAVPETSFAHGALRATLIGIVLLPPTFLMGCTLPLFCRHFVAHSARITGWVGGLYALNTLGGAVGAISAGLLLVPRIGVRESIFVAAAINACVGGLALGAGPARRVLVDPPLAALRLAPARKQRLAVTVLFFVTGFVALAQQVLWARYLGLLVANTIHTYTLTLFTILIGIVVGSLVASRFDRRGAAFVFGLLQVGLGLSALALMMLPPSAWRAVGGDFVITAALMLVPATLSGATFPLAVRLVVDDPARAGLGVGRMAAVNTAGGILGALVVGFFALPKLGLHHSVILNTGLSVGAGVAAWLFLAHEIPRLPRIAAAGVAATAWLLIPAALGTRLPEDFLASPEELVEVREGLQSNLAVVEKDGDLRLEIDRWWQGQRRKNHQVFAAHVPMLLHARPRDVLVVGAGAGQTPKRFLDYDVERVDCIDIEPAVFDLIRSHFDADWMEDPRVRLIGTDGRNHVMHTSATYDVISLELGQIFRPGVAWFYSVDFYERVRARLRPGGLVSQFVPITLLGTRDFQGVVATFLDVFPTSTLWYNTSELLLIGIVAPRFEIPAERLALLETNQRVRSDLRYSHWGGDAYWLHQPHVFLACFLSGPEELRKLADGAPKYRDNLPVLEYASARIDPAHSNEVAIVDLLRAHLASVPESSATPVPEDSIASIRAKNLRDIEASAFVRRALRLRDRGDYDGVVDSLDEAVRLNPESVVAHRLLGDAFVLQNLLGVAQPHYETALSMRPADAPSHRGLGFLLHRQGKLDEALTHYQAALRVAPRDAETHNNLATILGQRGDLEEARRHFEAALRIRPGFVDASKNLLQVQGALADDGAK